ncbi:hypothetical protein J6590_028530 [Homalodisca vitripennis]|nr:hypothetical protein J6590_028530 [Homalodisca vitripennis]
MNGTSHTENTTTRLKYEDYEIVRLAKEMSVYVRVARNSVFGFCYFQYSGKKNRYLPLQDSTRFRLSMSSTGRTKGRASVIVNYYVKDQPKTRSDPSERKHRTASVSGLHSITW